MGLDEFKALKETSKDIVLTMKKDLRTTISNVQKMEEACSKIRIVEEFIKGLLDIFELYSHHDGREIAIKLSSIYDVPLNKAKYLDDLQKFCKKDGENCERAISRLKTILIGIETNKRPGERTIDTEIQLRHHLRQIIL